MLSLSGNGLTLEEVMREWRQFFRQPGVGGGCVVVVGVEQEEGGGGEKGGGGEGYGVVNM